ncbi:MAG: META domain-containing protein [Pelagimonas sp.]|uniref:META domain-containing protein n=1 Tax=Pelagimonas sp. TaxID=2073170 RepID=UPI003D6A93B7
MRTLGLGMVLALATFVSACAEGDEGVRAYGAGDLTWVLTSLDGNEVASRATIAFPELGRAVGQAPCNRWSAEQSAPYPWFKLGPIASTRMACPDMQAEQRFFDALADMTISEVSGSVLVLSNDSGREMTFRTEPDGSSDP